MTTTDQPTTLAHCPWCQEDAGHCELTGGREPCEGRDEAAAMAAEVSRAPVVLIRAGGAS
jgi:hypothetical protein